MEAHTGGTKITCPHCGAENNLLAIICQNCGSSLVEEKAMDAFRSAPQPKEDQTNEADSKPMPPPVPSEIPTNKEQEATASTAGMAGQQQQESFPVEASILCPKCGQPNGNWRSVCEKCNAPLRYSVPPIPVKEQKQQQSFGASFWAACLTLFIANIANNLLTLLLAEIMPSTYSSAGGAMGCSIATLIVLVIIAFSITNNIVKRNDQV